MFVDKIKTYSLHLEPKHQQLIVYNEEKTIIQV